MPRISATAPTSLVLLASLLAAACGEAPDGGVRDRSEGDAGWAVVVGVSEYRHFPALEAGVAGAERMARVFQTSWEVPRERMRILLDGEATRASLRQALSEWLWESVAAGDFVLVYLGGYGSTVEDVSGDEEDGLDEAFCPADALPDSYANDILDDSISVWLERLPTDRVTLIMEGHQFGQGDHDPDHPGHEAHAGELPAMEAVGVTRCGERAIQEG